MQRLLTEREKLIFYITVAVIIFAISFNFFIAPILTKNDNLNKEINLARTKLKKYTRLLSQKNVILSKYNKFSSTLKASGQEEGALVNALSELENLAKNANIRIIDLRPRSASGSSTAYKEILIDLRTEGTTEGYLNFIYNLENSPSLLRIKRFQLSAKPATSLLEGNFSISQISVLE